MNILGKKVVVIGCTGLIGPHMVDRLIESDAREILFYDNFVRGQANRFDLGHTFKPFSLHKPYPTL